MSIIVLTPIVGLSFPALTPIIFAAAGALGYKAMVDMKEEGDLNDHLRHQIKETITVEIPAENLIREAGEGIRVEKSLTFQKGDVTLQIARNERGQMVVRVTGPKEATRGQLREMGEAFSQEIAQQFAFNRAIEEVGKLNAEVVEEEKLDNGELRVRFRRWH